MSAATIDRALAPCREKSGGPRRSPSQGIPLVRRSIPVRTFADWRDPPPGFVEADLVVHAPQKDGRSRAAIFGGRCRGQGARPLTDEAMGASSMRQQEWQGD
jgi:hypothetical protein